MKNFIIFNEKFIIFNTNLFDVENVNDRLSRKEGMLVGGAANIHHFQYKISSFSMQNSSFSIQNPDLLEERETVLADGHHTDVATDPFNNRTKSHCN